jgi:hypothetical protein
VLIVDPKRRLKRQFWHCIYFSSKLIIIFFFENKPISILCIIFSLDDLASATFATWWHLIGPFDVTNDIPNIITNVTIIMDEFHPLTFSSITCNEFVI